MGISKYTKKLDAWAQKFDMKIADLDKKVGDFTKQVKVAASISSRNLSIQDNVIYIESRSGRDCGDNILCILRELESGQYKTFKSYLWVKRKYRAAVQQMIDTYGLKNVTIVYSAIRASFIRSRAKYIISDTSLRSDFIKKEGQIVINTWHGTPFKVMGRSNLAEKHSLASVQQAFMNSDYLIYPNRFMKDVMIRDYMLENLCQAKCLCAGYPRNSNFFNEDFCKTQREKLGWDGQVIVYMPTWRGTISNKKHKKQNEELIAHFQEIDRNLTDNQTFYVKLHYFNESSLDFSQFKRVKPFPKSFSTYDTLAAADVLVTDYSSVFFDFANTGKKIVLFAYDEEEYFADRGVYFPYDELPFTKVKTVEHLIEEINSTKQVDYSDFKKRFDYFDNINATTNICRHIFNGEKVCLEEPVPSNGKENVLIYGGSLAKNGITSSLVNLLSLLDKREKNYIISYVQSFINREPSRAAVIPDDVAYMAIPWSATFDFGEKRAYKRFIKDDVAIDQLATFNEELPPKVNTFIKREWKRYYGSAKIDKVIQFDGYGSYHQLLFAASEKPSAVWVHSDLIQEKLTRGYNNLKVLNCCYKMYSKVVLVNNSLTDSILKIGAKQDQIRTVFNCFNGRRFQHKSTLDLMFDPDTVIVGATEERVKEILTSNSKKFITVGRFSPEKGHARLLQAFEKFYEEHNDTFLFIVGGHGTLYAKTVALAKSLKCRDNVIIIKSMSNPAPLVKACDLFVFSSFYEGLGLVLLEAASVGVPVVSTRISGVENLLKKYGGTCVDDSENGLFEGMKMYMDGKVNRMEIDFDNFNASSLQDFKDLLDDLK